MSIHSDYSSDQAAILTIKEAIESLESSANFLQHRLDTIQSQLDVHTFSLETMRIHVRKGSHTSSLRKLLHLIGVDEKQLTMGSFLNHLNQYLLQNDFIDLNDLQIRISPLLSLIFDFPTTVRKIPYPFLLKKLKDLFD